MAIPGFQSGRTALLVVDIQERLLPAIHNGPEVETQAGRLIDAAKLLDLPILATEQYRKGLGATVPAIGLRLQGACEIHEKLKFSAFIEPVRDQLQRLAVRSVLVCGIEAHVCVLQTCLELADTGFVTGVVLDAIGSRRAADRDAAVQRMIQAGIVPTTVESALFELLHEAGGDRFKAVLGLVK